jgi:hypothetical protein
VPPDLIMYLEQTTHNYIIHANCVYEFVSYNFNCILNIGTLNACLTKAFVLLTRTKTLSDCRDEKVCVCTII